MAFDTANASWSDTVGGQWQLGLSTTIISQNDSTAVVRASYAIRNVTSSTRSWTSNGGNLRSSTSSEPLHTVYAININGNTPSITVGSWEIHECGYADVTIYKRGSAQSIQFMAGWNNNIGGASVQRDIMIPAIPVYAPLDISVSVSDDWNASSCAVGFTPSQDTTHPCNAVRIERSVNGGAWALIASIDVSFAYGPGINYQVPNSFVDQNAPVNNSYQYRVCQVNSVGLGSYSYTSTVYKTPAAPSAFSAKRLTEDKLGITVTNPTYTATSLVVQRNARGSESWVDVGAFTGKVSYFEDSPGSGEFRYRAYNVISTGSVTRTSDWSAPSAYFAASCAPAAPTLISPASSAVLNVDDAITLRWRHNTIDGSSQVDAKLDYSTDGGRTWNHRRTGLANFSIFDANEFELNSTVMWRVSTRGLNAEYSTWSATQQFYVRSRPTVVVDGPTGVEPITNVPLHVELGYSDSSGSLSSVQVNIYEGASSLGSLVCTYDVGTSTSFDIPASVFMPENKKSYTMAIVVRSSSTFVETINRQFFIDFVEPMLGDLTVDYDSETGYATLRTTVISNEEREQAVELSIWRVSEAGRKLLAEHLEANSTIIDMYAPQNADFYYEVITFAESGVYAVQHFDEHFRSAKAFFYWRGKHASLKYSPEESESISRSSKKRVSYAGRTYPVSYDSVNMSHTLTISAMLFKRDDALPFRELLADGGRCIFKSLDGAVFNADADIDIDHNYKTRVVWGSISVKLVRIDGGLL